MTEGQNITSAVSNILDVDVASETTRLSKYQMLTQGGTAMIAQANTLPQLVLQLLR